MVGTGHFGQVGHLQGLRTKYHKRTPYKKYKEKQIRSWLCVCVCVCVRVCVCLHVPECACAHLKHPVVL